MIKLFLPVAVMAFFLTACSDSINNQDPPSSTATVATGLFKDSNVAGLSYVSGGQRGITGVDGSFTYEEGNTVTFSLGGVVLGTTIGGPVLTPIDLITNASSNSPQVRNIVRFLLMLDNDDDPDNGILISTEVRTIADTWSQVDFTSADLASELVNIIADVASVDARTPSLFTAAEAEEHIETTLLCIYAGAYNGRYTGGDQGTFGFLADARTGMIETIAYSTLDDAYFILTGNSAISPDYLRSFASSNADITYSGNFLSANSASGRWENSTLTPALSGDFSGNRIGGASDALYRFTGSYISTTGATDAGLFSFDIDSNNNVTGIAYSVIDDEQLNLSGTLTGTSLVASTTNNVAISATLNTTSGIISGGDWDGDDASGTFTGSGCRLN